MTECRTLCLCHLWQTCEDKTWVMEDKTWVMDDKTSWIIDVARDTNVCTCSQE